MIGIGNKKLKIPKFCSFTQPEIDKLNSLCNFTKEESEFFNLRAHDRTHIETAMMMNISTSKADKLSRKVKDKIIKVLPYC